MEANAANDEVGTNVAGSSGDISVDIAFFRAGAAFHSHIVPR
jgi:hypothetical protein